MGRFYVVAFECCVKVFLQARVQLCRRLQYRAAARDRDIWRADMERR
jgi:hypothetical protein